MNTAPGPDDQLALNRIRKVLQVRSGREYSPIIMMNTALGPVDRGFINSDGFWP